MTGGRLDGPCPGPDAGRFCIAAMGKRPGRPSWVIERGAGSFRQGALADPSQSGREQQLNIAGDLVTPHEDPGRPDGSTHDRPISTAGEEHQSLSPGACCGTKSSPLAKK